MTLSPFLLFETFLDSKILRILGVSDCKIFFLVKPASIFQSATLVPH